MGRGCVGGMAIGQQFFSPRDFHTPNIRTDVEKQNKSIYNTNEF